MGYTKTGEKVAINKLWNRRQSTKSNGVSYITQRGAEAVYTKEAQEEIAENAKLLPVDWQKKLMILKLLT